MLILTRDMEHTCTVVLYSDGYEQEGGKDGGGKQEGRMTEGRQEGRKEEGKQKAERREGRVFYCNLLPYCQK